MTRGGDRAGAGRADGRNGPDARAGSVLVLRRVAVSASRVSGCFDGRRRHGYRLPRDEGRRLGRQSLRLPRRSSLRWFGQLSALVLRHRRSRRRHLLGHAPRVTSSTASTAAPRRPALRRRPGVQVAASSGATSSRASVAACRLRSRVRRAFRLRQARRHSPRPASCGSRQRFGRRQPACSAAAFAAASAFSASALAAASRAAWSSASSLRLHLGGRLRLGAIAEAFQDLFHVVGIGAEDRHHRRRHHEGLAVIGAVRTRAEARLSRTAPGG